MQMRSVRLPSEIEYHAEVLATLRGAPSARTEARSQELSTMAG